MLTLTKVLAAVFPIYAFYSFQRRDDYELLRLCYFMSIVILIIGIASVWYSGIQMWQVVGAAGDISLELIYRGWKNSFTPITWSFLTAFILMGVGFAGPQFKSRITKKVIEPALAFVIPTSLTLFTFVLSVIILELAPIEDHFYLRHNTGWSGFVENLALTSFFAITILGVPVLVWWAFKIKSFLRSNPDFHRKKILISYFVLCTFFVISGLILLLIAYWRESFYYWC